MTGRKIFDKAIKLLGYDAIKSNSRITIRALEVINEVYADLYYTLNKDGFCPLKTLDGEIFLPENLLNTAAVYGICAMIAEGENDDTLAVLFEEKYLAARQLSKSEKIIDTLPHGVDF